MALDIETVKKRFSDKFLGAPKVFRAPARINIIGEHTDYNDGLVLPTTTALYTWVALAERRDRVLNMYSSHAGESKTIELDDLERYGKVNWSDYIRGVAIGLIAEGVPLRGANLYIESEIPVGGGLSSSASLELAVATALLSSSAARLTTRRLAEICQKAEIQTIGLQCGIMDQYAVARCKRGTAMLIDCRTQDVEFVDIDPSAGFLVVHSGVKHNLIEAEYNDRASECAQSLRILQRSNPQIKSLSDVSASQLVGHAEQLGETLYRRCCHVVSENERVAQAMTAIRNNNLNELGKLMSESHESLRDDYAVSCEESDKLTDLLSKRDGVYGARQIGAGFGGCVLALVAADRIKAAAHYVAANWTVGQGGEPWVHIVQPADPAMYVTDETGESTVNMAAGP